MESLNLKLQLWQAFVGAKARRVEKYYQDLLAPETKSVNNIELKSKESLDNKSSLESNADSVCAEKWKGQIEKVRKQSTYLKHLMVFFLLLH